MSVLWKPTREPPLWVTWLAGLWFNQPQAEDFLVKYSCPSPYKAKIYTNKHLSDLWLVFPYRLWIELNVLFLFNGLQWNSQDASKKLNSSFSDRQKGYRSFYQIIQFSLMGQEWLEIGEISFQELYGLLSMTDMWLDSHDKGFIKDESSRNSSFNTVFPRK